MISEEALLIDEQACIYAERRGHASRYSSYDIKSKPGKATSSRIIIVYRNDESGVIFGHDTDWKISFKDKYFIEAMIFKNNLY